MKTRSLNIILTITSLLLSVLAGCSHKHKPSTTYTNPLSDSIVIGDPFILNHNGNFYLYGTTDASRGFRAWKSTNLTDWAPLGFVLNNDQTWGDTNFWAPEVYFYNNAFYMVYSTKDTTGQGLMLLCLARAERPEGPFTDLYAPWFDYGYSTIDGHIFFDEDGKKYLYFDKVGYEGNWPDGFLYGQIYMMTLNDRLQPIDSPVFMITASQPWENPKSMRSRCNEGGTVLKNNDTYYLTYSANHYQDPFYGIGYATSSSPVGPWQKAAENPIVGLDESRNIFGPGHNSFFRAGEPSELFMVYHTHRSSEDKRRQFNIDRVVFTKEGKLKFVGPTRSPQPLPQWIP